MASHRIYFIIVDYFFISPCLDLPDIFIKLVQVSRCLQMSQGRKLSSQLNSTFWRKKLNNVKYKLEKRARDAQEAEQRKNDLVVYLAHDIKTPLTSIIGYLSLLDEARDMPVEQKEKYVTITLEKSYRLEQLINEFFEITRFNLQSIILEKDPIPLHHMLMQVADEFYPLLAPKGQKAIVKIDEDITIYADGNKLARVFNNILKKCNCLQ